MHQLGLDDESIAKEFEDGSELHIVRDDVAYRRLAMVNVVFLGPSDAEDGEWALIDAGLFGSKRWIRHAAENRFGAGSRPAAIFMTHGHFDHVGALKDLADEWEVPVYAHENELPYLNGSTSYPPPDPSVGGGMMAALSFLYPKKPVDVSRHLRMLPLDGRIPGFPEWRWIATPGHSAGHVSFWRESDRTLISGDAVITTNQESAYGVITQEPEIHGPPSYFTPDWTTARQSVQAIAGLEPALIVSGHGRALSGDAVRTALKKLAEDFEDIAVPKTGRYVSKPNP